MVDQVIGLVSQFSRGAVMTKFDVRSAYCNVPVHPSDRYLLYLKWRNQYYVALALPFRLCSTRCIFNSIADMVEWILVDSNHIPPLLHYLDDVITTGPLDSSQCVHNLRTVLTVCKWLGLPLHPGKCEGPAIVLVVLGVDLDSVNQAAHLPADKLSTLQGLISSWLPHKWCSRSELDSFIGHLHYAAKLVWPGRTYLCCMIDLLCCFRKKDNLIHLNKEFHLDLLWWNQFLSQWNRVSFWLFPGLLPEADVDVSSLGYGAFLKGFWFTGFWAPSQQQLLYDL